MLLMRTFPLISWIRERVDEITAAREEWDKENGIRRRSTFTLADGRRLKTDQTRRIVRRSTEVNVGTVQELFQFTRSNTQKKDKDRYSQKPTVSFLCRVVEEANRVLPFNSRSTLAIIGW